MKILKAGFVFLFLAGIAIPLVLLDRETTISLLERRPLASPPKVFVNSKLDKKRLARLPQQIDAYITDRFAFKNRLISFMNHVNFFVLHKSHDRKILVGKDKWLFYIDKSLGDEFANFKKSNLFNKAQLKAFMESLTLVNDVCEKNNIVFIFLIVPTTSSVYPEKYPFPRPKGISLAGQLLDAMPEYLRGKTIFPLDYLVSKKEEHTQPLYYNNGLHWNKLGVYYTYELLFDKLRADFPNLPEISFKFTPYMDPGEDNYTMIWWGMKQFGSFLELIDVKPENGWDSYYKYIICENVPENEFNNVIGNASKKGKYGVVTENKNPSLPTALIVRDSYFVDLEPFTSSIFSKAEYVWTQPEKRNIDYLDQLAQKPDVFILEIPERALEIIPMVEPGLFPYD
ncbi:alginate O-acetyltransferase AlgX-related protein [Leadbettera azotonutricia]|uniref:AlgX/AlgJ SGNH hydrolase-like domain-containing protein n=1 Tax=Leadbettera azotonutricia (strain ATCC BAA-888 / DSM 13862 / ZAS-9) TaxID=545695 RepID=F5YES6_LEAAZ|nr:hypothetical protein [Leadbettera azotonutricia]AEF83290.1 hypothetical protein TREAZ_0202 [Leadbettera azotonutricia ZAS-9]